MRYALAFRLQTPRPPVFRPLTSVLRPLIFAGAAIILSRAFSGRLLGHAKFSRTKRGFRLLFKFKIFVEKIWIIEMGTTDEYNGMVTTLAHAADIGNTHGEKNKRFNPRGIFGDAL